MASVSNRQLAVVTGASTGIGLELAKQCARNGLDVVVCFEAMMAGKDSVLGGGLKSKLQGIANEVLPETVKASQVAKSTRPGSGNPDRGSRSGS